MESHIDCSIIVSFAGSPTLSIYFALFWSLQKKYVRVKSKPNYQKATLPHEIPPLHTHRDSSDIKTPTPKQNQKISVSKDVEKPEPSCVTGGNVRWNSSYQGQYSSSPRTSTWNTSWSHHSASGSIPKVRKAETPTDICMPGSTATLVTIALSRMPPKYRLAYGWIKKIEDVHAEE